MGMGKWVAVVVANGTDPRARAATAGQGGSCQTLKSITRLLYSLRSSGEGNCSAQEEEIKPGELPEAGVGRDHPATRGECE